MYEESVATDSTTTEEYTYKPSTVSENSNENQELVFEYEESEASSTRTTRDESKGGLARPKAGWTSSSFAGFGSLIPVLNNTTVLPRPPETARLYWMIATGGRHGRNSGHIDDEYLNRITDVMDTKLKSRPTSIRVKNILSSRPELLPPRSDWAQVTKEVWQEKFPESTIYPDRQFQKARDPSWNLILPAEKFKDDDFDFIRNRPISDWIQYERSQKPVTKQAHTTGHKWDTDDQERVKNQAHATIAHQQMKDIRPDAIITAALTEFEQYVNEFWNNGHTWQKPPTLSIYLARYKNLADQATFEQSVLLCTQNKVI